MSPASPTQVSFGNFPHDVRARQLAEFLEKKVGLVLRCKIKKVSGFVPPHAFVHFISPIVAKEALKIADKGRLIFREKWVLKARMDEREWINGRKGLNSRVYSHIQLVDVVVEIGSVSGLSCMMVSWRGPDRGPIFRIEPAARRLRFFFTQYLKIGDPVENTRCDVMMEISLSEIKQVREMEREMDPVVLLQLASPPSIFYRTAEDDIYEYESDSSKLADDEDPWIRCLDIVTPDKSIGRCLDYRLTVSPRHKTAFMKTIAYFRDHGVLQKSVEPAYAISFESTRKPSNSEFFFSVPPEKAVPFELMFLVNALVHHGLVHVSNLSSSFYQLLRPETTPVILSTVALRQLLAYSSPIRDVTEELDSVIGWTRNESSMSKESRLTEEGMVVRRMIITPTRAVCVPPEIELSNRVIRHFRRLSDRFLRVSFLDENAQSIPSGSLSVQIAPIVREVTSTFVYTRTSVYNRIVSIMMDGFNLCGRHYDFLAFSAGQLRDCSAWFFAGDGYVDVKQIRKWMGSFPGGNVAKHAARMGQCFSATYSTMEVLKTECCDLLEIKRHGYDFSDGCGKIDPSFAQLVAKSLKLENNQPSAYQIRYGGYKGVVAVWPIEENRGKAFKLGLRRSMEKFITSHRQLEIVGWSKFLPCFLNRQIITLLSTLHVEDRLFMEMQESMVHTLDRMVTDRDLAYSTLMLTCTGELYSTALRMLCAGFDPQIEAHLHAMLVAIRAGQLQELIQKTKIFVPKGRWLMGCLDETATLAYGQCFVRASNPPSGECGKQKVGSVVITGKVIMTKNPCMHPGDIRVLEAVDVPALHHIVDCLVVPQNGPRPHPNEASGSDLDGDVYFVSWDERLVPPGGKSWDPMEYVSQVAKDIGRDVRTDDVVEFFAKHMINDSLGKICNAHVVHADRSPLGALDQKCLILAELAAKAVDYPKTGKPAVMPYDLKPTEYPDFMEKEDGMSYKSQKIIGQLYRKVQGILLKDDDALQFETTKGTPRVLGPVYDADLEVYGFEDHLGEAWALKNSYDQQLCAIMSHYNIKDEGEVVTGHIIFTTKNSRKQGDLKERARYAYLALKKEFSSLFLGGDKELGLTSGESIECIDDQIQQAKASAWYHVTYHDNWYRRSQGTLEADVHKRPLLSFPWIAVEQLVAIKNSKRKNTLNCA